MKTLTVIVIKNNIPKVVKLDRDMRKLIKKAYYEEQGKYENRQRKV